MRVNRQSGMVSILTVIFFMIFASILVVSFIRVVSYEQRQSIDNDLSASALAAAISGVEDGKRILLYCSTESVTNGNGNKNACKALLNSVDKCDTLGGGAGMNSVRNQLGLDALDPNNQVMVGGSAGAAFKQYYSCLTINSLTDKVTKKISSAQSALVPMTMDGTFDRIVVSWKTDAGKYEVPVANTSLPSYTAWKNSVTNTAWPPMLRLQAIPYTVPLDLDAVQANSRTLFLRPSTTNSNPSLSADNRAGTVGQLRSAPGGLTTYASCTAAISGYNCTSTITGFNAASQYYLRIGLLYADVADVSVQAYNGAIAPANLVKFDGVQPEIDVTGRANDVYRRVKALVSYGVPRSVVPEYALEAANICKDMVVATESTSLDRCHPNPVAEVTPPAAACKVGYNFIKNGNFSTSAGTGPYVDPAAQFTTGLPNRGPNTYPDDDGKYGPSPTWTGGFSIHDKGEVWYYLKDGVLMGSAADAQLVLHAPAFPGDPARGVAPSNSFFYSNPNQAIWQPIGTYDTFEGVLWEQQITGLEPYTKYEFLGYFKNMIAPPNNGAADPRIRLRVDGVDASSPITLGVSPDEWVPITMPFTTGNQTSVTLQIYDDAKNNDGDDFGMTGLNFYKCE